MADADWLRALAIVLAIIGVFLTTLKSGWWLPFEQPTTELLHPASAPSSSLIPPLLFVLGAVVVAGVVARRRAPRGVVHSHRFVVVGVLIALAGLLILIHRYSDAESLSLELLGDEAPWGLKNTTGSGTDGPIANPWPSIVIGAAFLSAAIALTRALDHRQHG